MTTFRRPNPLRLLRHALRTLSRARYIGGVLLAAASLTWASGAAAQQVYAAASLKNALDDLVTAYAQQTGHAKPVAVYASSSTLARQIEKGAPADIFISADQDWMDYAQKHDLIDNASRRNLLGNQLVLITALDNTTDVDLKPGVPLATLLGNGKLAMGDPTHVPAGLYGKAALEKLGAWSQVSSKVAGADNVRSALLLVARGEAPYGVVYRTDAAIEKRVRVAGVFPADSHPPIVYPIALTRHAAKDAEPFYRFLQTPQAAQVFQRYGFTQP